MELSRKRAKQASGLHLLPSLGRAVQHHPQQCIKETLMEPPYKLTEQLPDCKAPLSYETFPVQKEPLAPR